MYKKNLLFVTIILLFLSVMFSGCLNSQNNTGIDNNTNQNEGKNQTKETYLDKVFFSQSELKLDHEWRQYKITFMRNTIVEVLLKLEYHFKSTRNLAYFVLLTDGKKPLIYNETRGTPVMLDMMPKSAPIDISIISKFFKKRITFGERKTSDFIGKASEVRRFEVNKQTEWFYTIGVYDRTGEETIDVIITTEEPCMKVEEIDRGTTIELLTAQDGDFEGFYLGGLIYPFIKIGKFTVGPRFTGSILINLRKKIMLHKGSIIALVGVGSLIANAEIHGPTGKIYEQKLNLLRTIFKTKTIGLFFGLLKQLPGSWDFKLRFGIGGLQVVLLFYMDADPHCEYEDAPGWE